jgi:hypothetical protein
MEFDVKHKLLTYAAIAFVVFLIVSNPTSAATTAHHIGSGLADAATSFGDFLGALTSGGGQ